NLKILRFDSKAPWAVDDSALENSYTTTKSVLRYQLGQNYPNPFNPETWIPYQLAEFSDVTINIYNLRGELIRAIKLGRKEAGPYLSKERSAYWDGRNETGERVASGIYFYTMRADEFNATRKMLVWQ
ncbi:T9SS type A sorting domain-containing protein, partial [bacterium]|nr:T9SS type A sorting domain-containing protein [bacterium]